MKLKQPRCGKCAIDKLKHPTSLIRQIQMSALCACLAYLTLTALHKSPWSIKLQHISGDNIWYI